MTYVKGFFSDFYNSRIGIRLNQNIHNMPMLFQENNQKICYFVIVRQMKSDGAFKCTHFEFQKSKKIFKEKILFF